MCPSTYPTLHGCDTQVATYYYDIVPVRAHDPVGLRGLQISTANATGIEFDWKVSAHGVQLTRKHLV